MKSSYPKKSFSGNDKSAPRKKASRSYSRSASIGYEKSDRHERPAKREYTPSTTYGVNAKASSYRGKDFRSEGFEKEVPKTYSSTPSSSPKSVYIKTERPQYSGRKDVMLPKTRLRKSTSSDARKTESDSAKVTSKKDGVSSSTSWGPVASWYDAHLEKNGDTYHEKVVYPNMLRLLGDISGKKVLDLACGQGQFSRRMRESGAFVTGIDLGKELIALAEANNKSVKDTGTHKVTYINGSADDLYMIKDETFDSVVCILALQNIEKLDRTLEEVNRVLVQGGSFIFVLNHPSFRNPKQAHWGYDESQSVQYRRVDEYMSESHVKIDMTPGSKTNKKFTVSFHRPLQMYVKALSKNGFLINRLEEWTSHRESEKGPKQRAENKSRKEIPLFMCIGCRRD